ncbi:HMG domain-containing protein 4 isoform X2 [Rana temporaria]|uniref:HMG domain-containing protein 4 isoform X2 n=1 Tax=Rana temporaria TaxID=8407 RepID=UPI001AACEF15|nr:HMG domain-containing protein 4 isoform X2 [Rana temporaria]
MAFSDSREILDTDRGMEDVSLAAGRSQREKKRSYKDLLREEEEIAEQVRKSSKKRSKDIEITPLATESHKKKKKHSSDDTYYPDVKKKKKHSHPSSSPSSDTAMDLLNSISSPVVSSSKHSSKKAEKTLASPVGFQSPAQVTRKEHRKKGKEDTPEDLSHKSKKPKPLTLREPEGLKMKLVISPKEKTSEQPLLTQENPVNSDKSSSKKSSKKSKDETEKSSHKKHKKETHTPRHGGTPDTASSSGGDVEAGDLVIDDSLGEMKKKKKSKKSKKKKDKHKEDKHRKHNKSKKEHGLESPKLMASSVLSSSPATTSSPPPLPSPPATVLLPTPVVLPLPEGTTEKKKKKEEVEKPKKKNMSAYQVFSKEYRSSIIAEHPGIDFGELSKKLAEVWKQLPEKDKLVWKQKAQYLQHKQNKAEATTVKRKSSPTESSSKSKGSSSSSSLKKSSSSTLSFSSSPAKAPDTEPIDVAAHLQLLGESLSLIGHRLQETEVMISKNPGMVAVSGSLSVLLDSVLCALGPLVCLTSHIPQLNACPKQVLSNTLDNIAYVMPGL